MNMEDKPGIQKTSDAFLYKPLTQQAKVMRRNPTVAEQTLWNKLRNSQLGYKFRRQHIINKFIVDFYCLEKSLIIEVDGKIHDQQKQRDIEREHILTALGCKILRFTNNEVMEKINIVIDTIKNSL